MRMKKSKKWKNENFTENERLRICCIQKRVKNDAFCVCELPYCDEKKRMKKKLCLIFFAKNLNLKKETKKNGKMI